MALGWRIAGQSLFFHECRKIAFCQLARLDQDGPEHPVISLRNVAAVRRQGDLRIVQFGDKFIDRRHAQLEPVQRVDNQ